MENNEISASSSNSNKRKESKKFLKIYMLTLLSVVIILISLSYYGQEKLNQEIEQLTSEIDLQQKEVIYHMNSIEELQDFSIHQAEEIQSYKEITNEYISKIDFYENALILYQEFLVLERFFQQKDYNSTIEYINSVNQYENFSEFIDLNTRFNVIIDEILLNDEILSLLLDEQINILKDIQK